MYYIPTTYLTVRDDEGPIVFQREDLMRYSGNRGLIASGVTFRLLNAAFEDLCPNEIPRREYFRFRTSFPGDEVRYILTIKRMSVPDFSIPASER